MHATIQNVKKSIHKSSKQLSMKIHVSFIALAILVILFPALKTNAQDKPIREPYTLTHHMSPQEKAMFHLVGKDYVATDPPPGEIWNIAEFEKMEGVLVGYPGSFGIPYNLIAAMSEETMVTTIVENNNQLNYVTNQYTSQGVNMDNTNFIVTALDSYWTRDFGPWYVRYGDDQIGIVDFIYNRPNRPNDNAVPPQMADFLGIEWFGMDLITAGGNYMTNGYGISSCTDLTWDENPTLTPEEIDEMVLDYLGVTDYHVVPDPNNTYIDHIDCWGKFLDVDKVLIREVPETHPQYDEIETTADYFAAQTSGWGVPFEVYRVWTPNNEPYTNSLILNDRVFLPIVGGQWDDEAVAAYEEAMPGYEILTFTGSWESTDALHCRTKGIADRNTLYIQHIPLLGEQPVQTDYEIEAIITAYSGEAIVNDEVKVLYQINGGNMEEMIMTDEGNKEYVATFSNVQEGSEISYYITAVDEGGFTGNSPFIGAPDPHVFYAGEQLFAEIAIDNTEIVAWVNQGYIDVEELNISNTGGLDLNYNIEYSSAFYEDYEFIIEDSPAPDAWSSNTFDELGWVELDVDNVVGEIAGWSIDFHWQTDQYPEDGTFYIESPAGTEILIAAGIPTGDYTFDIDQFNGEQMQGTWKLWIEDSYGDGGIQATDIQLNITKTYTVYPWLSVDPVIGVLGPDESQTIEISCDGSVLPIGDYEGKMWINSNDPDFNTIEIPIYFTIDFSSGINDFNTEEYQVINYPNPFTHQTTFDIYLPSESIVELEIYNLSGQKVHTLLNNKFPQGLQSVKWLGDDLQGNSVNSGIYFYHLKVGEYEVIRKLILMDK